MRKTVPIAELRQRRIPRAAALALAFGAVPALAQLAPNSLPSNQNLPQQAAPQLPASDQVAPLPQPQAIPTPRATTTQETSFLLRDVVFNGASVYSQAVLHAKIADKLGKQVTLNDLDLIAKQITDMYHESGYYFATAVVPVQQVKNGVVEISVVEGQLGHIAIDIDPNAPISETKVRGMLASLVAGQPLNGREYERAMLLLSDVPGIKAQSALQAGAAPGTTDLVVKVAKGKVLNISTGLDNFGTRESGTMRAGGSVRWNSPFGIGDNLDVRALVSERGGTVFGRLSYEAPLGDNGMRIGFGAARVNYSLGGAFEALNALGASNIYDASLTIPVIRQRNENLFLRFSADSKDLTDELRAVHYDSHKQVNGLGVGWAWERRDNAWGGGYWSSNGVLYHGDLDIRSASARALDQSRYGNHTNGGFTKLSFQFARLQTLGARQTLFLGVGGQLSNRDLDASEKISLGGHDAVRAYPAGEVLVDQGFIANLEYRYAWRKDITLYSFYDASRGWLNRSHSAAGGTPMRSLRGPGIGINWAKPGDFSIDLTVAWRNTQPAVTSGGDKNPRVFFQVQKFF